MRKDGHFKMTREEELKDYTVEFHLIVKPKLGQHFDEIVQDIQDTLADLEEYTIVTRIL